MNKKQLVLLILIVGSMVSLNSCEKFAPEAPSEDEILDGPVEGLTHSQTAQFLLGDNAFNARIFTAETGLGSIFVASSCGSCHAGDGKGHPFTTLTRFGQVDSSGNQYLHLGGPQLQNRALPGFTPEQIPAGATFTRITPPGTTGLGFIELVSDADILALSDPNDVNGDGISGVPNWINIPAYVQPPANAIQQNGKYIGRFGKKAGVFNLLQQIANAYNQDMGITSIFEPYDVYSLQEIDPEVSTQEVLNVVFYVQTLKAPIQRNQEDATVNLGRQLFSNADCDKCHTPTLTTGISSIDALSNKTIHPYTDLLLHDMGVGLDDGYTEGNAKTYEWKTPALWGLGLSPKSQGGQFFLMHDGRASSIEGAILMHGGEASNSKTKFQNLSSSDKSALLAFLNSL
ncbi:MAG: thiol oxidoreductase [Bacteroidetes bacterium]|nr:thiol oxidoreductase [Bacteroidota bacterium]